MTLSRNDTAYLYGCKAAQDTYGLSSYARPIKIAAAATQDDSSLLTGQNALIAGAAVSPFAGMIGQERLIHDPMHGAQMQSFNTMEELARAARPGDVLATTKPSDSIWKGFITPPTGSSFYHIQPVLGQTPEGLGTSATAGEFHDYEGPKSQTISGKETLQKALPIPEAMAQEGYTDMVLLRPKNMTDAQRQKFIEESSERISRKYDAPHAVKSFFHEMFVPKLEALGSLGGEVICEGNVCSTLPAQALHEATGAKVVKGKPSHMVYPPDFLRSPEFEAVGSHVRPGTYTTGALRKAMPYLYRGGVGLGLGALAYGATEDPAAMVAVPAAAALTDLATTGAARGYYGLRGLPADLTGASAAARAARGLSGPPTVAEAAERVLPSTMDFMTHLLDDPSLHREQVLKSFYGKKLPLLALGSLAGLYGLNKAREHFKKNKSADESS